LVALCIVSMGLAPAGCDRSGNDPPAAPALVLYTSVDEPYARPIVLEFTRRTGVAVVIQTDTEATKSAGLAARLEAERDRPRADVWWGNEVFHTIRLADAGVLAPYASPAAADIPARHRDADHLWAGNGLRARVIATHADPSAPDSYPPATRLDDLLDPQHRGRVGVARPTAGTTGGHFAALYVLWGRDRFTDFVAKLKANDVKLLGGNGPVAEAVGRGDLQVGLTDNDDVAAVVRNGLDVTAVPPDQDGPGTLVIPTTVALVAGRPAPADHAKRLIDYLLSAEVERKLIDARFAGWSVRAPPSELRVMDVDYRAAAAALPEAVRTAMRILEGRE
jgi:iron(III) transport system substrate-binding protein